MTRVPLAYIARNLWTRRATTVLTAGGVALVVFVFATVLMLEAGLRRTLIDTGSPDNVIVLRRAAESEVQSGIDRPSAAVVTSQPEIAMGADGEPLVSRETVVLISLGKRDSADASNVGIRGMSPVGLALRPQVHLVQGRMFRPGATEVVVGSSVQRRFAGTDPGERLHFGQREWTVVGTFDTGGTGFDSEIWGDVDQLMQAFRRPVYSSVTFRLADMATFERVQSTLEGDPRLSVSAKVETVYYAQQSERLATFIRYLGIAMSTIFSLGAIIGATITMYSAVANRTAEIGTLRAIGFPRSSILTAFLTEAMLLSAVGGAIGVALASLMQWVSFSTTNFQSFSELAFRFELTPGIVGEALGFALFMGLLGGFLPAARAARLDIVDALRSA